MRTFFEQGYSSDADISARGGGGGVNQCGNFAYKEVYFVRTSFMDGPTGYIMQIFVTFLFSIRYSPILVHPLLTFSVQSSQ